MPSEILAAVWESLTAPLSSRQVAFVIWGPIVGLIAIAFPGVRSWLSRATKRILELRVLGVWIALSTYSVLVVATLMHFDVWNWSMSRATLAWLFLGLPAVSQKLAKPGRWIHFNTYGTSLALSTVAFEVLFALQPLDLWIELSFWPFYALSALLSGTAAALELKHVERAGFAAATLLTIALFVYGVYALVLQWPTLDKRVLVLPVILAGSIWLPLHTWAKIRTGTDSSPDQV